MSCISRLSSANTTLFGCLLVVGCHNPADNGATNNRSNASSAVVKVASSASNSVGSAAIATAKPEKAEKSGPLNVLMLTVDCLRADMPWNGYERPIAPNLTKLVESSTVYTNAYAASSYTAQSVAAILSGRFASTLYRSGVFFTSYPKANLFFPEVLAEKQIRSIGWFSHLYFGRGKGIEQGFDVWELVPGITFNPQTDEHVTSPKMLELGLKLLAEPKNTSGQFFAWAHFGDPHDQYIKHPESPDFGNKTRDKYDSEVWFTDYHIGKILDWAKEQPWWSHTAVVISGDHGEAFGEHGQYRHAFEIWENLVRVPLIVHIPGGKTQRITERRSHIDLAPTLMALLGQEPLEQFTGKSLLPEILGNEKPANREPIVVELTEDSNNPQRRAIIAGNYKLTVRGRGAAYFLYDLANDPGETKNVAQEQPEKLAEMKALYLKTFERIPSIDPYGGNKLESGRLANGPMGPRPSK
jgi:arylsulfatase A-like enzyme